MESSSLTRLQIPTGQHHEPQRRTQHPPSPRSALTRTFALTDNPDLEHHNLVKNLHSQLNGLIDQLNDKVEGVIDRHEVEFLAAYRSHIKKMRKELDEYRASTHQLNTSGEKQLIGLLEKESAVLRDELTKVFQKLENKSLEVERLKLRLDEVEKENRFMQAELKKLMLRMKVEAVSKTLQPPEESISTTIPARPHSKYERHHESRDQSINMQKKPSHARNRSSNLSEAQTSLQQQLRSVVGINYQLEERLLAVIQPLMDQKDTKYNELRDKYYLQIKQTERTLQTTTARSQLENFFLQCIEEVRRQLYRKMPRSIVHSYNQACLDFEVFKKQDRQKILERFLENQQAVRLIFDSTFRACSTSKRTKASS